MVCGSGLGDCGGGVLLLLLLLLLSFYLSLQPAFPSSLPSPRIVVGVVVADTGAGELVWRGGT